MVSIDSTPATGLSVISVAPVSRKPMAGSIAGIVPRGDRFECHRGHLQRILLAGCADHAGLDVLDARAAAVDRDDQHRAVILADGLEGLVAHPPPPAR